MHNDFFQLYDTLLDGIDSEEPVRITLSGPLWTLAETDTGTGLAMTTAGDSRPPLLSAGLKGLPLKEAAKAVKSWRFSEACPGLAAVNAYYNTPARLEALGAYWPFEKHYADGLDLCGKTVGIIGHMHGPKGMRDLAKEVYIIEKSPQPGDYPDSACDWILPRCDLVFITGSSLVNKTLPHLLELCRDAYTILTGPSVPLCPALLEMGIDRLAGLVVKDRPGIRSHVISGVHGHPYGYGLPFVFSR